MKRVLVVVAALGVCGCQWNSDYLAMSNLMPTSESAFRHVSAFDAVYPHDDPDAEAGRLWALGETLEEAGLCASGYEIVDRSVVVERHSVFGAPMGYIRYTGVCVESSTDQTNAIAG